MIIEFTSLSDFSDMAACDFSDMAACDFSTMAAAASRVKLRIPPLWGIVHLLEIIAFGGWGKGLEN